MNMYQFILKNIKKLWNIVNIDFEAIQIRFESKKIYVTPYVGTGKNQKPKH